MTKERKTQEIQSVGTKEVYEIMSCFTNQPVLNVMLSENGVSNKGYIVTTKDKFPYAFAILEYVDGVTFREYLHQEKVFKSDIVYEIGRMCAAIHKKTYSEFAEVNENLEILKPMPLIDEQIYDLLNNKAGTYLQKETIKCLENYIETHGNLCSQLNESSVLIHGDMRFNNILINHEKVYFLL